MINNAMHKALQEFGRVGIVICEDFSRRCWSRIGVAELRSQKLGGIYPSIYI